MLTLKTLLAVLGAVFIHAGTAFSQTDSLPTPLFEWRIAREAPAAGHIPMSPLTEGPTVYVAESSFLTDADIEHATAKVEEDGMVLWIEFAPGGAARLRAESEQHVGSRIAVLIESRLVSAPIITSVLGSPLVVSLAMPRADASRIATAVAERW